MVPTREIAAFLAMPVKINPDRTKGRRLFRNNERGRVGAHSHHRAGDDEHAKTHYEPIDPFHVYREFQCIF